MNQTELNRIAMSFLEQQSMEVADKLKHVLTEDLNERAKEVPGMTVHYVHNVALFRALMFINCVFCAENKSKDALKEYCQYAETFKEKFLDIVEALKDFVPSGKNPGETAGDNE